MKNFKTIISILVLVVAVAIFGISMWKKHALKQELGKKGVDAVAVVERKISKKIRKSSSSRKKRRAMSRGYRYEYYLEISFYAHTREQMDAFTNAGEEPDDDSGTLKRAKLSVSKSSYGNYDDDDDVDIIYLPEDPKKVMLKEDLL